MKSTTIIAIIIALALIGGVLVFTGGVAKSPAPISDNVSVIDGKQIIEISARGGYSPRAISAKSGLPTIIRMKTVGTFDCSSALVIPSINYRTNLPTTGITDIALPSQKSGVTMRGLCAMGMFSFNIEFN